MIAEFQNRVKLPEAELGLLEPLLALFNSSIWITRGFVRCLLLEDIQPTDDLDIVVDVSQETLSLAVSAISERQTVHGGFKLATFGPRQVDIWSLTNTFGQACNSIEQALGLYEFTCDAFAVDCVTGQLSCDPGAIASLQDRSFDIQTGLLREGESLEYILNKAVYLAIRHGLTVGPKLDRLFTEHRARPLSTGLAHHAMNLGNELRVLDREAGAVGLAAQYPSLESRLETMFDHQ